MSTNIYELSKVLAVLLVEQGSYSYIDKISQTSSKDLALYHVREALRDYHSLLSKGFEKEVATELAKAINFHELEREILELKGLTDVTQLREKTSLLTAQALAEAGRLIGRREYLVAMKVLEYLRTKGLLKENVEELSKIMEEKAKELSEALDVPEEDVVSVARNKQLLERLTKKM
ncbi:MAG: hypothetical protein QXL22_06220 [Candidatus Nezhaarchaeales archaeon]